MSYCVKDVQMATVERSTGSTEGDQQERALSPSEEDSPLVLNDTSAPLNFSELTPCQFGISVQSFTPTSLSNNKDKSRLAQIKARRRSNIGVRGSPETNSLIRFMAQQRMKTPKTLRTPELVRNSPFLPQVASSLRQKMASFQTLMDVEESEVCDPMPRQDSSTGGRIKTRDYLSDGNSPDGEKENHPPLMTPTPSKRRRLGPRETCELQIRETNTPILHFTLKEQEGDEEPVTQGPLPSSETVAQAVLISPPLHADFERPACSLTKTQQGSVFEHQSPSQPLSDGLKAAPPAWPASSFHIPSLPSVLEMKPTGDDDSAGNSTVKGKKKSVRFGVPLSPEFFDKNQPPSTPLQKGGTPARAPTPGGSLQLRSVLKTPQRSESQTPQVQPNLSSPTAFGSSPTLSVPRNRRMQSVGEDNEEKIVFSSVEEIDSALTSDTGTQPSTASSMDSMYELTSLPEQEKQCEVGVEAPAPAQSSNRTRKQPEECEPVKTLTRSAAKTASGKMKMKDGVFELQSPSQPPPDGLAAAPPAWPASSFHIPSLPSLLEIKPTGDDDSTGNSTVKGKKKSVRFGVPLSPEFFDKNQPPSTPLQKGGTPARAPTPGGSLQLRSVLKTPQRSESQTPQVQPNLSSPTAFGSSPTLSVPRNRRMQSVGEDNEEKIVFSSVEEIDSALTSDTEWDIKPLNLNTAFHEESQSPVLTESETQPSTASQMDALGELTSLPEQEKHCEVGVEAPAPAQSSNRRKKQPGPEHESTSEAPARSSSRKRKPEESEPVKRSTRSAAKAASGKMTMTSTATRRWNRDVDRSLYGSRAYASKNPTLSPITERLSFIGPSPAAQQTPTMSYTVPNHETHLDPEMTNNSQPIGDPTVTNASESPSEEFITSSDCRRESTRSSRRAGPRVSGRGLKKRKVSVADGILLHEDTLDKTGGMMEEHCEDQTTTNFEASRETPLTHSIPEQAPVDTELSGQTCTDAEHCIDSDGKLECHGSLDAPTSDCPPSGEDTLEPAQRKTKRGRRSSLNSSVLQGQENQAEEHQTSHEGEEREQGDQAANQQQSNIRSSSDSQEEGGAANLDLAPWQTDFNFEDVFKSVATRGKRSVRRSLRNQSNAEHSSNSAGLAWLSQTPPDTSKEARRRTRGQRLSAAPPAQPSLPEETQDHAS
ncbi:cell division cycle-associated protein 2 isoform X4 [Chelmon rostratus]|uniref:cell division cycle-associated protein 2 isoform X4 n=1 Tax=Chelmon rostratus TaxID=109905 RepID=UPI001BEB399F|nr:cell division cycle-associated protein 2 isoform X4 [Chelmon rostratus]